MKPEILEYALEGMKIVIDLFKAIRRPEDAVALLSQLRGLGPVDRADLDAIKRDLLPPRFPTGTGESD